LIKDIVKAVEAYCNNGKAIEFESALYHKAIEILNIEPSILNRKLVNRKLFDQQFVHDQNETHLNNKP